MARSALWWTWHGSPLPCFMCLFYVLEPAGGEVGQSSSSEGQIEANNNIHVPCVISSVPLVTEMPPPAGVNQFILCNIV